MEFSFCDTFILNTNTLPSGDPFGIVPDPKTNFMLNQISLFIKDIVKLFRQKIIKQAKSI